MKKKLCVIAMIITIIGIIVVITKGFNVNLKYKAHQEISLPIGKEFNISDIKSITNDVFGKKKYVEIQKSTLYGETAIISVDTVSQDQLDNLKNKVIEKYNLQATTQENTNNTADTNSTTNTTTSTFEVTSQEVPRVTLIDIAKQYSLYIGMSAIIILIYFAIKFNKLGVIKVLIKTILSIAFSELLYMSIVAITRYPIDIVAIISAIIIYIIVVTYLNKDFIKQTEKK